MPSALITGITGQDGSYLAELLLSKGYEVHGLVRRKATNEFPNIQHIRDRLQIHYGDILDRTSLAEAVSKSKPDEVYNLAAQSFVGLSWSNPNYTLETGVIGLLNVLEELRKHNSTARVYQASSSEIFGNNDVVGKSFDENSPMVPASPYGVGKLAAHRLCQIYRRSYGMFVVGGILFNHESEKRGPEFLSRKVAIGVARIVKGAQKSLPLGNLDAWRDWGYAKEYVTAMWTMLQQKEPEDFVIGTGVAHQVKDMVRESLKAAGLEPDFGKYVELSKADLRPWDVSFLQANPARAEKKLGWKAKVHMPELMKIMVGAELEALGLK
jgi:GDPmannose 4,6-dehydratase